MLYPGFETWTLGNTVETWKLSKCGYGEEWNSEAEPLAVTLSLHRNNRRVYSLN